MWDVIRRTQGLALNENALACEPAEEQYQRNQRCILLHEAKPPVPHIDPKTMTRAYGDFHYEKVRRWLLDEDVQLRLQAADQLIELFTEKREHRVKCLEYNILPILFSTLCEDPEEVLRERAATALQMVVQEPVAQDRMLRVVAQSQSADEFVVGHFEEEEGDAAIGDLQQRLLTEALADSSDLVVMLSLRVMIGCHGYANNYALTEHMVDLGAVPIVLELVRQSPNPLVRAVACSALVPMFDVKEAHIIFQRAGGMKIVTDAVRGAEDDMLVAEAAEVISRAAEWPQGKRDAVSFGTIAALLPFVRSANLSVRVAVAAALAQITVWEPAKFQAVETPDLTTAACQLLAEEDERDVIAHLAKLIYHVAEHPDGRAALRSCKPRLLTLLEYADSEDLSVRLALQNGIEILSRK